MDKKLSGCVLGFFGVPLPKESSLKPDQNSARGATSPTWTVTVSGQPITINYNGKEIDRYSHACGRILRIFLCVLFFLPVIAAAYWSRIDNPNKSPEQMLAVMLSGKMNKVQIQAYTENSEGIFSLKTPAQPETPHSSPSPEVMTSSSKPKNPPPGPSRDEINKGLSDETVRAFSE